MNTIRTFIARFLLGLLVLMQINTVVFRHAHRLDNGQIITHAHPYNLFGNQIAGPSCPLSPNPHTTHELLLLDAVSNAAFMPTFALLIVFLIVTISVVNQLVMTWPTVVLPAIFLAHPTLRGPPFRLLS